MKDTARAAAKLGVQTVVGFTGSSIWHTLAMFPPVAAGDTRRLPGLRRPVEPDPRRLRRGRGALRARGAPQRDRLRLLDHAARSRRSATGPAFGLNWDPSHFVWQELDPVEFIFDFADRIYHVDCKDTKVRTGDGRRGRLASTCPGPTCAAAGTSSPPATATPWEDGFRVLNSIGYDGPISIEWEDAGMDRLVGAPEALEFVRRLAFDSARGGLRRRLRDRWVTHSARRVPFRAIG